MPPLLVSVSPYVPLRNSPYAGHQWYFHHLTAMSRHYEVVTVAPGTEQNREAASGSVPTEVVLAPGLGHWRTTELQGAPWDKLGDELLRGVLRIDGALRPLLGRASVVDLQWPRALPHAPALRAAAPGAVLTYLAHDLHHTNWSWDRLSGLSTGKRLVGYGIGPVVRRRELRLIDRCDAFFAFKQADIDAVRASGVSTPGARLAPWLERPSPTGTSDSISASTTSKEVVFVAAFDRTQNRWGADWLLEQVWPLVRARVSDARLILAGGGAPADLQAAVERCPGATMTGFVEDLGAVYEGAACVVAPVLGGAGVRFKVPQAMLYGRPLVVTPLALEGLESAPAECFVAVTDVPGDFAEGIVAALTGSPEAGRAAQLGPMWVDAELSFERSTEVVLEVHQRLTAR